MEDLLLLDGTTLATDLKDDNILEKEDVLENNVTEAEKKEDDILEVEILPEININKEVISVPFKKSVVKKQCKLFRKSTSSDKKSIFGGVGNNILIGGIILSFVSILVK